MLELFPGGFEEIDGAGEVELVAYTDPAGEELLWKMFGGARGDDVAEDWEDRWKAFHRPVRVGRLWVGPPWAQSDDDALAVVIDPGRAFGTGAHETTRLCLGFLQEVPQGSLLDIGCGSGVLAIAAAKLGFDPVLAVDSDPAAVEAAVSNAVANEVEVDVRLADALVAELPRADVAVLNIAFDTVSAIAPRVDCAWLVASGYLAADRPEPRGFRRVERRTDGDWAADLCARE